MGLQISSSSHLHDWLSSHTAGLPLTFPLPAHTVQLCPTSLDSEAASGVWQRLMGVIKHPKVNPPDHSPSGRGSSGLPSLWPPDSQLLSRFDKRFYLCLLIVDLAWDTALSANAMSCSLQFDFPCFLGMTSSEPQACEAISPVKSCAFFLAPQRGADPVLGRGGRSQRVHTGGTIYPQRESLPPPAGIWASLLTSPQSTGPTCNLISFLPFPSYQSADSSTSHEFPQQALLFRPFFPNSLTCHLELFL